MSLSVMALPGTLFEVETRTKLGQEVYGSVCDRCLYINGLGERSRVNTMLGQCFNSDSDQMAPAWYYKAVGRHLYP